MHGTMFATEEEVWARAMTYLLINIFDDTSAMISWQNYLDNFGWHKTENQLWWKELEAMLLAEGFQI